jgi:glycosyltransferase involved in cell wall biosynthesis
VIANEAKPRLTVIVPARNAASTIGIQLASLAEQDYPQPWEVVVVDNASHDDTAAIVHSWFGRLANLRLVECATAGVNRARNAGVRAARGDLVLVCDADDAVTPGWVSGMASGLESFDIVGGLLDYVRFNPPEVRAGRERLASTELPIAPNGRRYAVGANIAFRRVVHEAIDGFDESFRIGSDEIDFCLRAQYAGFTLGLVPDAVIHYRLRSRMREVYRQNYAYATGFAHLHRKHIDLGRLPAPGRLHQAKVVVEHCRIAAAVWRVVDPAQRARYARDAAWCAGSLAGLLRYRILV